MIKEAFKVGIALVVYVGGIALMLGGMMAILYYAGQERSTDIAEVMAVEDPSDTTLYQRTLFHIKWREGYRDSVYVDVVGYGTTGWGLRVTYLDSIPKNAHQQQIALRSTFVKYYDIMQKRYPGYGRHQYLAMTSLYFNVGNFGNNLHKALREHDEEATLKWWAKYTYVGGRHHARSAMSREFEMDLFRGKYGK